MCPKSVIQSVIKYLEVKQLLYYFNAYCKSINNPLNIQFVLKYNYAYLEIITLMRIKVSLQNFRLHHQLNFNF